MNSSRPYLIRAINEWILDNALTPYMLVNAEVGGVDVPRQHVDNGKIVLNINPQAITNLHIANDHVEFSARFSGVAMAVYVPVEAVMAVYARENGKGMVFSEDDGSDKPPEAPEPTKARKPALKVVK